MAKQSMSMHLDRGESYKEISKLLFPPVLSVLENPAALEESRANDCGPSSR